MVQGENRLITEGPAFECFAYTSMKELCHIVDEVLRGISINDRYVIINIKHVKAEVILYDKEIGNVFIEARLHEEPEVNKLLIRALATAAKVLLKG